MEYLDERQHTSDSNLWKATSWLQVLER